MYGWPPTLPSRPALIRRSTRRRASSRLAEISISAIPLLASGVVWNSLVCSNAQGGLWCCCMLAPAPGGTLLLLCWPLSACHMTRRADLRLVADSTGFVLGWLRYIARCYVWGMFMLCTRASLCEQCSLVSNMSGSVVAECVPCCWPCCCAAVSQAACSLDWLALPHDADPCGLACCRA